jgi:uncharacterized protein (DUF2147 family)
VVIRDENGSIKGRYFADNFVAIEPEGVNSKQKQEDTIIKSREGKIPEPFKNKTYKCFFCGKTDNFLYRGRNGENYCKDHILPENRDFITRHDQKTIKSIPLPNYRCKNPLCNRRIYRTDIIQCGPCGNFFCKYCWENHRWCHGKSPAVGIGYSSDGSWYGYNGSE